MEMNPNSVSVDLFLSTSSKKINFIPNIFISNILTTVKCFLIKSSSTGKGKDVQAAGNNQGPSHSSVWVTTDKSRTSLNTREFMHITSYVIIFTVKIICTPPIAALLASQWAGKATNNSNK